MSPPGTHRGPEPLWWGHPVLAEQFLCLQGRAELTSGGFIQQSRVFSVPWAVPGVFLAHCTGVSSVHVLCLFSAPRLCCCSQEQPRGRIVSTDKTQHLGISLFEAPFPGFPFVPLCIRDFCAYLGRCRVSRLSPRSRRCCWASSPPAELTPQECAAGPAFAGPGKPSELGFRQFTACVKVCAPISLPVHPHELWVRLSGGLKHPGF